MADELRNQVNKARRQGIPDDAIANYLKDSDPRIAQALGEGIPASKILSFIAPPLTTGEEVVRKTKVAIRGASEALAPVAAGAAAGALIGGTVGGPVGAIAGGLAAPTADALVGAWNYLADDNVRRPSQIISNMLPGPRAESPTERVIQSASGALAGTGGQVRAGMRLVEAAKSAPGLPSTVAPQLANIGKEVSRSAVGQTVTAPVAAAVGQTVTEATDNPFLGLAAATATSVAAGMRTTKREAVPDTDKLLARSKSNYETLDKSGFELDSAQFKQHISTLPAKLRKEIGYVESVNPKVAGAFKELLSDAPKDVAEITALRKIIGAAAKSKDPAESMAAMRLLDEFDDYILNAPSSAVVGGDKSAVLAWKEARADYSKVKKSELIEDIVLRAEVSQGGKEATVAAGLSALAKNKNKMRFFSPDEQEAIRDAAKGGSLQVMLRTLAKFAPMTPAAAIFTAVAPYGAYTAGVGITARELASARRLQQVNRLTEQMRLGRKPEILEGAFANEPMYVTNALRNSILGPVQQNQNAMSR